MVLLGKERVQRKGTVSIQAGLPVLFWDWATQPSIPVAANLTEWNGDPTLIVCFDPAIGPGQRAAVHTYPAAFVIDAELFKLMQQE